MDTTNIENGIQIYEVDMVQALNHSVRTVRKSYFNNNISHAFMDSFNKISRVLFFCITPEDTTDTGEARSFSIKNPGYNISGAFKTGFWIAMSIILAMLMGQLN
ncbi:hypothetical protein SAMN02746065_13128 [Desulfocicer vacuolatum DSM 3385]|uniref:Uncharacterized protein n=1 Tax=Desulfocicer vacuolatum DSM 3385 TaxID=1121400 RepID=A0A1W2EGT4_9BACT|nr:hypothetical protein [Desulfocicer vacuolatum]SMD08923.1 hypothetical protein SAMN02746065_13128 [Desulfocicer vacuolatum DSM 3385]